MADFIWKLLINIVLMVFAIISITELIYNDKGEGSFFRKVKKRGWWLIGFALLSIVFNFFFDWRSDRNQQYTEAAKAKSDSLLIESQKELAALQVSTKDSIIRKVDSVYSKSIRLSNEALAKYNLEITDSLTSVINKLEIDATHPLLSLRSITPSGHEPAFLNRAKDTFHIQFVSYGGISYNCNVNCYFIDESKNEFDILYYSGLLHGGTSIVETTNENRWSTSIIGIPEELKNYSNLLVYLTGSYSKDPLGDYLIPYNEAFHYNFKVDKWIAESSMDFYALKKALRIN